MAGTISYESVPGFGLPGPRGALHLTPDALLDAGRVYTAAVVGAMDAWGNRMETPYTWHFATPDRVPFGLVVRIRWWD